MRRELESGPTARHVRVEIEGAVQGVGFRPFVYRLARELGLRGWVANDPRGVTIEAQGSAAGLNRLVERLSAEAPEAAAIERLTATARHPVDLPPFEIRTSRRGGAATAQLLPDLATCDACLAELFDPADRRHRYPFINCTCCGPRQSIIDALPYDRTRTTMASFTMCDACQREYDDPADRRFHAQPNACPSCGPRLELLDADGRSVATHDAALTETARAIESGGIVAAKGLGGFHLMVDARNGDAIARLRKRKPRRDKPLALMAADLEQAGRLCRLNELATRLLHSPAAPIILAPRRTDSPAHDGVAPDSPTLGVMLPSNPLHHLLMRELGFPVVATSGNLSDEPICIEEREAVERLSGIADLFLVHDRPIARQVDDSILRVADDHATPVRRARGYAPGAIVSDRELPALLAVGAHLKNAAAISVGRRVFVSQHIGDMETAESVRAFERIVRDFLEMYTVRPVAVAHDLHPGYVTTRWAEERGLPRIGVQHHHAHLASCLADNDRSEPALGVIWDGTGHGIDGTIWGGEFLLGNAEGYRRVAHLRPFSLPGGEVAIREPRRTAAALLWELDGPAGLDRGEPAYLEGFGATERSVLVSMLERGINTPRCTSAGRLFDGVAALLGLHPVTTFEGQAAMALEAVADTSVRDAYPLGLDRRDENGRWIVDWEPLIRAVLEDVARGRAAGTVAARFHNGLADAAVGVAERCAVSSVALSGGCFQNSLLVERVRARLVAAGFEVLMHRRVPPNDGGIALGQIAVAAATIEGATHVPGRPG